MKNKTAVEWLQEALEDTILTHEQIMQTIGLFEQAKAMEKEQIINFGKIVADKWGMIPVPLENIEDTYSENFKSE